MRQQVEVSAVHPGGTAEGALAVLRELDRHVTVGGVIRALRFEQLDDDARISRWDVKFRKGILRWTQRDEFDDDAQTMRFTLIEGDPHVLEGHWRASKEDGGCRITFSCEFDLGVPSLAEFLDPVAARILRESVSGQLVEIFGPTLVFDEAPGRFGRGSPAEPAGL